MTVIETFYTIILIYVVKGSTLPVKTKLLNITFVSGEPAIKRTLSFDLTPNINISHQNETYKTSSKLEKEANFRNKPNSKETSSNETTMENYINSSNLLNGKIHMVDDIDIKENNKNMSSQESWVKHKDKNDIQAINSGNQTDEDRQTMRIRQSSDSPFLKVDLVKKQITNYTENNGNDLRNKLKQFPKTDDVFETKNKETDKVVNVVERTVSLNTSTKTYNKNDFLTFQNIRDVLAKLQNTRTQNSKAFKRGGGSKRGSTKHRETTMRRQNLIKKKFYSKNLKDRYIPTDENLGTPTYSYIRRNDFPQFLFSGGLNGFQLNVVI